MFRLYQQLFSFRTKLYPWREHHEISVWFIETKTFYGQSSLRFFSGNYRNRSEGRFYCLHEVFIPVVTITNQNTKGECRIQVYNLLFREKVWVSLSPLTVETLAIIRPHRSLLSQQDHYSFNKNQIFTCCLNETEETLTRKKFNRQAIILKDLRSLLTVCSAFAVCISSRFCWVIVIQGPGEDLSVFLDRQVTK